MLRNTQLFALVRLLVLALFVAFPLGATVAQADGSDDDSDFVKRRIVLLVEEGETIFLVPPPPEVPTGTSGPLSAVKFGPIGSFQTGLLSGEPVAPFLFQAIATGSAIAGPVGGSFTLPRGTITDEHTAWLTLSPEEPKFAEEFGIPAEDIAVVIVTAEGTITGGTKRFRKATGRSKLYLKVEVPKNLSALPINRTAQFVFEFDKNDKNDDNDDD